MAASLTKSLLARLEVKATEEYTIENGTANLSINFDGTEKSVRCDQMAVSSEKTECTSEDKAFLLPSIRASDRSPTENVLLYGRRARYSALTLRTCVMPVRFSSSLVGNSKVNQSQQETNGRGSKSALVNAFRKKNEYKRNIRPTGA